MRTRWIRSSLGETCCAVCGGLKRDQEFCCPVTENPGTFEEFKKEYFGVDDPVPYAIAREFYDDYRIGNYRQ